MKENSKSAEEKIWLPPPSEIKPEDAFKNDALDRKIYGVNARPAIEWVMERYQNNHEL